MEMNSDAAPCGEQRRTEKAADQKAENGYAQRCQQAGQDEIVRPQIFSCPHHGRGDGNRGEGKHCCDIAGEPDGKAGCDGMESIGKRQTCHYGQNQSGQSEVGDYLGGEPGKDDEYEPDPCSGQISRHFLDVISGPFVQSALEQNVSECDGADLDDQKCPSDMFDGLLPVHGENNSAGFPSLRRE